MPHELHRVRAGPAARRARMVRFLERGISLDRPRRPSPDAPVLGRGLGRTARLCMLALLFAVIWVWLPGLGAGAAVNAVDVAVLHWAAEHSDAARSLVPSMQAGDAIRLVGWSVIVLLIATRQWRRLAVYVGVVQLTLLTTMADRLAHPRPYGVTYLARAAGDSLPSWPVAGIAVTGVAAAYALVPAGRRRRRVVAVTSLGIVALAVLRVLAGLDRPSAALIGLLFGSSLAVVGFDVFAPDTMYPVRRHRPSAHLDLASRRSGIDAALLMQAGLVVRDLEPFRLAGSTGSTPMRLLLEGPGPRQLFGKLYSTSHLRSDRAFKLVRAIRYGALEDEAPFSNVRSLVEHEDYVLRVLRDGGCRVPRALGVVEIVREREYIVLTEFLDGASELRDANIDDFDMDDALSQIRTLWRIGVAHRDIKPSNVLLRPDGVWLIDVGFGEIRASSWRRSVDLANMMLVLALRSDVGRVLDRALLQFDPDEIAAAFAATHSATIPSQLHALLRADGRELIAEFRSRLPPRPRVRIQRWTPRRLAITAMTVAGAASTGGLVWLNLNATGWL